MEQESNGLLVKSFLSGLVSKTDKLYTAVVWQTPERPVATIITSLALCCYRCECRRPVLIKWRRRCIYIYIKRPRNFAGLKRPCACTLCVLSAASPNIVNIRLCVCVYVCECVWVYIQNVPKSANILMFPKKILIYSKIILPWSGVNPTIR